MAFSKILEKQQAISFDEIGTLSYAAQCLASFSTYPDAWVEASDPIEYLGRVRTLAEHKLNVAAYRARLMVRWTEELLTLDGQSLLDEFNQVSVKWFFGKLHGMKQLRQRLSTASKTEVSDDMLGQDLADLVAYQQEEASADSLFSFLYTYNINY